MLNNMKQVQSKQHAARHRPFVAWSKHGHLACVKHCTSKALQSAEAIACGSVVAPFLPQTHARSTAVCKSLASPSELAATSSSPNIDWNNVYNGGELPPRFVGPITVSNIEGKGRGVVASRPIRAGELLLVSTPLVYLAAETEGVLPDVQQLLDKLNSGTYTEDQLQWLRAMFNGDEFSDPKPVPDLHAAVNTNTASATRPVSEEDVEEALRLNVLALNMFGEEFQDLPASLVRGDLPVGHLGLWPEFSLINHSCAPNAINYTVCDRMVVRAGQDIGQGAEIAINYLGRSSLRPASERLMDLRDGYGFACACPRCSLEMEDTHVDAVMAVTDAFQKVMFDMVPNLQATLGGEIQPGDPRGTAMVQQTRTRLQPLISAMEQKLSAESTQQTIPSPVPSSSATGSLTVADWLRASAFEAYGLQAQLRDVEQQLASASAGEPQSAAATNGATDSELQGYEAKMLDIAGKVASGSDLHLFLAVKALSRAQQLHGPESDIAMAAQGHVFDVVGLRYGPDLDDEVLARLVQASAISLERVAV